MAGYKDDFSMSNNAADAYEAGEKPLSKWTKKDIIAVVGKDVINRNPQLKALNLKELRAIFLTQDGWHHTSKMYNETNFYACRPLEDIKENPDNAIYDLSANAPYPQPHAPAKACFDSNCAEAIKFRKDFNEWKNKMKKLEDIIQAIAAGEIK